MFTVKKIWFPYAPRSLLRKLLMPFYAKSNFDFGLFERDGMILDQCAMFEAFATYFLAEKHSLSASSLKIEFLFIWWVNLKHDETLL